MFYPFFTNPVFIIQHRCSPSQYLLQLVREPSCHPPDISIFEGLLLFLGRNGEKDYALAAFSAVDAAPPCPHDDLALSWRQNYFHYTISGTTPTLQKTA